MQAQAYREKVGIEHRPYNHLLHQALGVLLASDVVPPQASALIQHLVADQLQDIRVQLLKLLRKLAQGPCQASFLIECLMGTGD